MSEDVSAQIRTGVTIIVVAALVSVLLNLMVVAQSIVSSGMGTLQSGVDQIQLQEYEAYNQKKVSGIEVKTALQLYSGRDVCVIIRTTLAQNNSVAYCYGSLLKTSAGAPTSGTDSQTGSTVWTIPDSAFTGSANRNTGEAFYTMEYYTDTYNVIQCNADTKGIVSNGNAQYVLDSARFRSELIKNSTGTIVGIVFTQLA